MGLPKYDGPLAPVPSWLDPAAEIKDPPSIRLAPYDFALFCVDGFVAAGSPLLRAFELAACKVYETGWGKAFRANNLGGVKATPGWAKGYKARTGKSAPFYRAHGNRGTGDSQTVIYRGYDSPASFFAEWLAHFVPKPKPCAPSLEGTSPRAGDYRLAGERFWGAGDWFAAMLSAYYRGSVTRAKPAQSMRDQASLSRDMREAWAQRALSVAVDGKWGPRSRAACEAFQRSKGLPVTGLPDDATCVALAHRGG